MTARHGNDITSNLNAFQVVSTSKSRSKNSLWTRRIRPSQFFKDGMISTFTSDELVSGAFNYQ